VALLALLEVDDAQDASDLRSATVDLTVAGDGGHRDADAARSQCGDRGGQDTAARGEFDEA
jgi:hypothetical protein